MSPVLEIGAGTGNLTKLFFFQAEDGIRDADVTGQTCALPISAFVLKYGKDNFPKPVSEKISFYKQRLLYWQENTDKLGLDWADFLADDTSPNKERILTEKRKDRKSVV